MYDEKKKDEEREKLLLELEELKEKQQEHSTTISRLQVSTKIPLTPTEREGIAFSIWKYCCI